jgi:Flp pilus assembly protein protease CpaA
MDLVFAFVLSLAVVYDPRTRCIPVPLTAGGLLATLPYGAVAAEWAWANGITRP